MTSSRYHNIYIDGAVCFWTSSITARVPILRSPTACYAILDILDECRNRYGVKIIGYVLMPDHIHLALWSTESNSIQLFIKRFLSQSAYTLIKMTDKAASDGNELVKQWSEVFHRKDGKVKVWKERGRAFPVTDPKALRQKLSYIHQNPVRLGLVDRAEDFDFSSARCCTDRATAFEIDELDW